MESIFGSQGLLFCPEFLVEGRSQTLSDLLIRLLSGFMVESSRDLANDSRLRGLLKKILSDYNWNHVTAQSRNPARSIEQSAAEERKGKQIMLQFLQTGKVLYVLAAMCGLGMISKLVTSSLYKRLIKETGNMALTRNKNLRSLKQRTESMLMMSHGIKNTNAYIEKQLYGFRFMKLSLDGWDNLSVQAMILCFLVGGFAAFGAYWYRIDSYYIVLYGTIGILSGLSLVLVDNSVNISAKRQHLVESLIDYVDNTPHFFRSVDKSANPDGVETKSASVAESSKRRLREMERKTKKLKVVDEAYADGGEENGNKLFSALSRKKGRKEPKVQGMSVLQANGSVGSPGDYAAEQKNRVLTQEEELRRSIDGLKQSLEQIAASRDQSDSEGRSGAVKKKENGSLERARRELSQEDIKLLGELLQEYLT